MTQQTPDVETSLRITKTIVAPRELVFKAWTEPERLKQWWGVEASFSTPIAEVDLRTGGRYRLGMLAPGESAPYVVGGVFQEVRCPEKLVYTWKWEQPHDGGTGGSIPDPSGDTSHTGDFQDMLVTVEFLDLGGSTEVVVTHEHFPDQNSKDEHNHGWNGCLNQLATLLERAGS